MRRKNTPQENMLAEAFFQQIDRLNSSNAGQEEVYAVLSEFGFEKVTAKDVKKAMMDDDVHWSKQLLY